MAKRRRGPTLIQSSRRVSPETKALMHELQGRVLRKFLGLTDEDERTIAQKLDQALTRRLQELT